MSLDFNHYSVSAHASWIITIALVGLILWINGQSRLVVRFSVYTLSISAWSYGYAQMANAPDPSSGLFWFLL
jgi:hypothetical protein